MHVDLLISQIMPKIPFSSEQAAEYFLKSYSYDDQLRFISALYIGRIHIHSNSLNSDCNIPCPDGRRLFDDIEQTEFARILYEKNTCLTGYFNSFIRCVPHQMRNLF